MFQDKLKDLQKNQVFRTIKDREAAQGPRIHFEGREFINFASNDYLGLSNHPEVVNSAKAAMEQFGFGSGASRLLSGGTVLHTELEQKIAQFKETEAALVFNSGYAANTGIIPSIAGERDIIFSDELNHASIIDGCRLSRAKTMMYRHKDISHLSELIKKEISAGRVKGKFIVVTDTVFSMDGDIASLKEIHDVCISLNSELRTPDSVLFYLDDAHGTGVLGAGRGALAHFNIKTEPWIIQMGTFSKALGSYGAFVAGNRNVIEWIINTARSFVFSTALPPCVIAASLKALELVNSTSDLVGRLRENRIKFVKALDKTGFAAESETPIIPLKIGNTGDTLKAAQNLYKKGIYVPAIRPPTVKEPRLRITVTAAHSEEDINSLAKALSEIRPVQN